MTQFKTEEDARKVFGGTALFYNIDKLSEKLINPANIRARIVIDKTIFYVIL